MANIGWKIARTRGYAQLPLGIVAVLAVVLLLIAKAQTTLFDRTRAHIADWMAPALEVARSPLSEFDKWLGSAGEVFRVYRENLKLKDENARLLQWRNQAIVLQERLRRYQLLLHAVPDPELSSVMAQVIGRSSRPFQETMIIDAGAANGVKPGQAVIDARGMVGRIFIAGKRTSWVILLTDLNSRIPVTIEPGNVSAIMAGDNSGKPAIEIVSQNAQLKAGDQVSSSGDGSLLPPGLPVGTLVGTNGNYRVQLLADPASSQDVNVLDFKRPIENLPKPGPSDLPATAADLPPAVTPPVPGETPPAPPTMPVTNAAPATTNASAPTPSISPSTSAGVSAQNRTSTTPPSTPSGGDDDTNQ